MKTRSALIQIFNENGLEYTEDAYLETLSVRYAVAHPLNSKRCKAWLCPSAERTGKPWKVEFKGKFVKWCKTREEAQSLIDIIEG